ncbi:NAD(P)-dependent oxidoreductase [Rathayibacter sp. ZW T2_19]|uniref:NAD(P)-dependent oxidoreductase n=1 Tax=Rathayibacter rubneri TaxID=2950106 RepID=A0A9X2DWN0_9MICO|nr:NAD(P)-dependent oxidoreductase [Rathayibacter rubneri]MCM6762557.1 NAD(P)-dependent oxidoreductase [Rathayibacter rubneri]
MRIAVTGASGRLGRSVVEVLRDAGHDVRPLDRERPEGPGAVAVDLTDAAAARSVLAGIAPDAVVHLAAIAVPFSAPEHRIFTTNTVMAFSVVEAAVAAGATRVLVASSPTVLGYGARDWVPERLPLDERIPVAPAHAYSLSKVCVEEMTAMFARSTAGVRFASFRPCFVIAPEEWAGATTQQGHSILDRLRDPALASVSLFNYVDARDAGEFVERWLAADSAPSGACYFVGAQDAFATRPLAELLPEHLPGTASAARHLVGTLPAFDSSAAERDTGWVARRSWRTELDPAALASLLPPDAVAAQEPALSQRTAS